VFEVIVEDECCVMTQGFNASVKQMNCKSKKQGS
jgi:hypothetical protein